MVFLNSRAYCLLVVAHFALYLSFRPLFFPGDPDEKNLDSPAKVVHTHYDAEAVEDNCIACADRCQMDATIVDDVARINAERRLGSDLYVPECPNEAWAMRRKTADAQ